MSNFNTIEEAVEDLKLGKAIIVIDDEERENEGDLVIATKKVTPEIINFMIKHGRGLVCVSLPKDRLDQLKLKDMVTEEANTESEKCKFTISIDFKHGTTTGISAFDRAKTIKALIDNNNTSIDFAKPGHIFPLRSETGGVLKRAGHTEASADLARIAGFYPSGVICEILNDDGSMARTPNLIEFSKKHNLKIITIADLIKYRRKQEKLIVREVETDLQTEHGNFKLVAYRSLIDNKEHFALVKGGGSNNKEPHNLNGKENVLVRVHSQCFTGDVLSSQRCDCKHQLKKAMQTIEKEGLGVILYMQQEGRGIGILNKLKAYKLQQEEGLDTVEANERLGFKADLRDYGLGAQILKDLGLTTIRLLTNNPKKIAGLSGYGLNIVERISINCEKNKYNTHYLNTKKIKLGHLIE